jgi:hypothetical protein
MHIPTKKRALRCLTLLLAAAVATGEAPANDSNDLNARAEKIAQQQLEQFGEGYTSKIDRQRHLIYVSALDEEHLNETAEVLSSFYDAYRQTMGSLAPKWNITILLPSAEDFRKLAPDSRCRGTYYARGRKLLALDRGETLLHEFTHALYDADAGGLYHPLWVIEGLASLFQSSEITPSGLEPYVDGLVGVVQEAIYQKRAIPLETLFKMKREEFAKDARLAYAQSRYVMYYLYKHDRLRGFHQRLKANFSNDPHGIQAFELSLTSNLAAIDKEWQEWVLKLRPKDGLYLKRLAVLGVKVQQHTDGAEVTAIDHGGAAKRADRLRIGDVIRKFDGKAVAEPDDLYAALGACEAKQTVEIGLLRNGRALTVRQPLDAPEQKQ